MGIFVNDCTDIDIINCISHSVPTGSQSTTETTFASHLVLANICFQSASDNNLINCTSYNSPYGIYIGINSNDNYVANCTSYNNNYGICLERSSNNNLIHHNNFINNVGTNAYDACSNQWDDGITGNYWSDYTGVDDDGNGIGDTPYNISGDGNQDRYPLMAPRDEVQFAT
ncbi:unnamed protein product [marine sediment metagenome]|uniref:Periplasmic copper-binding protein NosD beta helix domain-containing protein n=1 Tax=marine sediment metagenome TaxID=412755 RepID=X1EQM8_9ZZZZ